MTSNDSKLSDQSASHTILDKINANNSDTSINKVKT